MRSAFTDRHVHHQLQLGTTSGPVVEGLRQDVGGLPPFSAKTAELHNHCQGPSGVTWPFSFTVRGLVMPKRGERPGESTWYQLVRLARSSF
jgi:hypothetical protein